MDSPLSLAQADRPAVALARRVWRAALRWRARLFQRRRLERAVLEEVEGAPLVVLPGVFNPVVFRTGAFLARQVAAGLVPPGSSVLDMGTGSGACAVVAARRAGRVLAVDVNPAAVRCARVNVLVNGVEQRVEARQGDLFAPVNGERFDVVLFNPPFYRGAPRDAADRAWRSVDVVERFAAGLAGHLKPDGCAYVVLSSDGERDAFLEAFRATGLGMETVAEKDLVNETLSVYRLRPGENVA